MNKSYGKIKELGAELLAIHVECSPDGTARTIRRNSIGFPMANDEKLEVVSQYSPTSTFVIDADGIVRARWLDAIHRRVGPDAIIEVLSNIRRPLPD